MDYYEQERTLHEYLAFHYPDGDPMRAILGAAAPPPSERFPLGVRAFWEARPDGAALDVGAACGRMTFELARDHARAVGLDRSRALVRTARAVRDGGVARYRTTEEGDLSDLREVAVSAPRHASFLVGDALALPFPDASFETVLALNLVDRVPDPARALDEAARVVRPGGLLIVASPFTWLAEFTPRERWLGGFLRDGEPVRGIETVRTRLSKGFETEASESMPFFLPHHARSGQLGSALVLKLRRHA